MVERDNKDLELEKEDAAYKDLMNSYLPVRNMLDTLVWTIRKNLEGGGAGFSYGTNRDIYAALGYPAAISYDNFYSWYRRDPLAKRIVNAIPDIVWSEPPEISEDKEVDETNFEKEFGDLTKRVKLWHYFKRAHKMARIGRYSVMFLGFSGSVQLNQEPILGSKLNYIRAYAESSATIEKYVTDRNDARFGLPELYQLTADIGNTVISEKVHWSRIIHIVEDPFESNVMGLPTLENVFNLLIASLQVVGGGAEAFWRAAFPGYGFITDPELQITSTQETEMKAKMEAFVHQLQRYITVSGFSDIKEFAASISDPKNTLDIIIDLISVGTGLPKRIFTGSEIGLASSEQDRMNLGDRTREWRVEKEFFIRDFIDRIIYYGSVPSPDKGDGYDIYWPPTYPQTEDEKATVAQKRVQTIGDYIFKGVELLIPPKMFLTREMGYSQDEADAIEKERDKEYKEEEDFVEDTKKIEKDQEEENSQEEGN